MMKTFTFLLLAISIPGVLFSQKYIQIMNQRFEMSAIRNGQPVKVETRDYGLSINYDTGEFYARINITESRLYSDDEVEYRIPGDEILEIQGIIPIIEILDNKSMNREYIFELNVKHLSTNVVVAFTFNTTQISNSSRGFTAFRVSGKINLLEFGVQDLKGYDPEVDLILDFQANMIGG